MTSFANDSSHLLRVRPSPLPKLQCSGLRICLPPASSPCKRVLRFVDHSRGDAGFQIAARSRASTQLQTAIVQTRPVNSARQSSPTASQPARARRTAAAQPPQSTPRPPGRAHPRNPAELTHVPPPLADSQLPPQTNPRNPAELTHATRRSRPTAAPKASVQLRRCDALRVRCPRSRARQGSAQAESAPHPADPPRTNRCHQPRLHKRCTTAVVHSSPAEPGHLLYTTASCAARASGANPQTRHRR